MAGAVAGYHDGGIGNGHWAVEVALAPAGRDDEGTAIRLAAGLVPAGTPHTLWSFRPEQQLAAQALGYEAFRDLLLMTVALPAVPSEAVPGYHLRRFRPGADEEKVARLNNRAFAGHRENSHMSGDVIRSRERVEWFSAAGFLIAEDEEGIAGFCWTKLERGRVGEIYLIGVDPAHHGRGLGRWLLSAGLDHLHRDRGAVTGQLWTDGGNPAVRHLYLPAGFATKLINREMRPAQPKG
jgi:mycothiol synthase